MIFVIDVGNTNMTMGVFCGEKLAATFRIMTKTPRTSDEYGIMITQLLKNNGIEISDIEGAIIASVVPDVMHSLTSSIIRYLHTKPLIVGPGVKSGIKVATEDPRGIGADRIVDAVAAYVKYGGPVLVLDFGTATTYDLITADGRFTAGITAPGIRISWFKSICPLFIRSKLFCIQSGQTYRLFGSSIILPVTLSGRWQMEHSFSYSLSSLDVSSTTPLTASSSFWSSVFSSSIVVFFSSDIC